MAHKSFYEAAAGEVAAGRLDRALWIKVCAEMPSMDDSARRAKYIALRAQELAVENAGTTLRRWMPHSVGSWIVYLIAAFVAAVIVADVLGSLGTMNGTPIPLIAFCAVMGVALIFGISRSRAANGANRPAEAPSSTQAK